MAENSLDASMDSARKHYSSMFFLPSLRTAFLAVLGVCLVGVSLSSYLLYPSIGSLVLGISLFALTLLSVALTNKFLLKKDPIFTIRRTLVVSLVGWLFWLLFAAIGVGLSFVFGNLLWVKLTLLGFATVVTLRIVVVTAVSSAEKWRQMTSALLEPVLCVAIFLIFWAIVGLGVTWQILAYVIVAIPISFATIYLLLSSIDRLGQAAYGLPALSLFRAFILNWVTDQNEPLERILETMGEDADIEVSLLKFDSSKPKAAFIVPLVHPGPFKNIGSSLLPSLLKNGYQQEFGCVACVPLGILGHELDLASQAQNHKIVAQVTSNASFEATSSLASPYVKASEGFATVGCQIFGDTAILSFSIAPKTTEDLPQELGREVAQEARKLGLKKIVVVNAHNSLTDIVDTEVHLGEMRKAALLCLHQAVSMQTKPFMVGAATVFPNEFSLKDGMGTGGITAIVVMVENHKTVYIVIDGNNIISGLREKLLNSLFDNGFDNGEVFTTDTHAVSALVTGRRGYHPIGEAMDHNILTRYLVEAAKKAEANLEPARSGGLQFTVPKVRVIGEERLNAISTLVDKAIAKVKHNVVPIFGVEGLVLVLLLLLI